MANCFHCKKELDGGHRPGRGESCPQCGSDVKVCLNCRFYDRGAYNQCREPSAERVVDKDRANFCEFFEFGGGAQGASAEDPFKKLRELFKS
jgi:rRNA maturation protein Nop10